LGWRGHACVKNLPRVGGEVCAQFDGDWSGGLDMKRVQRYKQSHFYIYRYKLPIFTFKVEDSKLTLTMHFLNEMGRLVSCHYNFSMNLSPYSLHGKPNKNEKKFLIIQVSFGGVALDSQGQ